MTKLREKNLAAILLKKLKQTEPTKSYLTIRKMHSFHGTTILSVETETGLAMGGDGQVTLGDESESKHGQS